MEFPKAFPLEARALLAAVVESSYDAIISKDLNGVVTSWNAAAERLFGWTADEAVGRPITLIIPAERRDEEPRILAKVRRGERVDTFETVRVAKDGRLLDVALTVSPVRDSSGTIVGASKVARDITARNRAERAARESRALLDLITDNLPALISYVDKEYVYQFNNRAYEDWFDRPRSEITGRHVRDVLGAEAWEKVRPYMAAALAGQLVSYEDELPYPGSGPRWVHATYIPHGNPGTFDGFTVLVTDVSDSKRNEAALVDADRRKNEFLATLAHELRNPLAPIRNSVAVMMAKNSPDPELAWATRVIDRQVQQMARLLDDLLDVSRISRDKLDLRKERITLAAVLGNALETSQPLLDAQRHEFSMLLPDTPIWLDADPMRLAQVFSNLLNNAANYTASGGRIRIVAEQKGRDVVVQVEDNGVGIEPTVLPSLFEMFSQGTSAPRPTHGLGIGLSLVRGLVNLHGGSVTATSAGPAKGSTFTVRLPVAAQAPARPRPASDDGDRPNRHGTRVLIADDNRDSADSLAMLLRLNGHQTHTAYDGAEAIAAAASYRPDVILLDIGMPNVNGIDAARQVRGTPWGKKVLLVALTGWGQEEDRRRTKAAGFDAHFVKPVDSAALEQLLAAYKGAGKRRNR